MNNPRNVDLLTAIPYVDITCDSNILAQFFFNCANTPQSRGYNSHVVCGGKQIAVTSLF